MQGVETPGALCQLRHRHAEWQGRLRRIPPLQFRWQQDWWQEQFGLNPRPFARIPTSDALHVDWRPLLCRSWQHLGPFDAVITPARSVEHRIAETGCTEPALVFLLLFDDGDQAGDEHIRDDLALNGIRVSLGRHHSHIRRLRRHGPTPTTTPRRLARLRRVVGVEVEGPVRHRPIAYRLGLPRHDGNARDGPQVFNRQNVGAASPGELSEQRLVEHHLRRRRCDFRRQPLCHLGSQSLLAREFVRRNFFHHHDLGIRSIRLFDDLQRLLLRRGLHSTVSRHAAPGQRTRRQADHDSNHLLAVIEQERQQRILVECNTGRSHDAILLRMGRFNSAALGAGAGFSTASAGATASPCPGSKPTAFSLGGVARPTVPRSSRVTS